MKIFGIAILAGILMPAGFAQAAPRQNAASTPQVPHMDSAQSGKLAMGLICKNARDLKNLFQARAWTQPRPDPELAVRQVNVAAHDPQACELSVRPYKGEHEQVDRIVRKPGEVYLIVRFTPLYGPQYLYMLLPGE